MPGAPNRKAATAILLLLAGCGSDGDRTGPDQPTTADYITAVSATLQQGAEARSLEPQLIDGQWRKPPFQRLASALTDPIHLTAEYRPGAPPDYTGDLATMTSLESTPLMGEPFRLRIGAGGSFTDISILVAGLDGYYWLRLPYGVSLLEVVVTLAGTPPTAEFTLATILGNEERTGEPFTLHLVPGDLQTGDIVVTLNWTGASDVDLHVIDPLGQEVAWFNTSTPEGGHLDLDSNPACQIDNVNREIISWPERSAPHGRYKIIVDYYDDCGVAFSDWGVSVTHRQDESGIGTGTNFWRGTFTGRAALSEPVLVQELNYR